MKSVSIGALGSEMLTRRTATVTISAPEASTAAAFWAKSLYLPVPTISREAKVRPATCQMSSISAPAHEGDDLIIVAVLDLDVGEGRARDDLQIALDGDATRLETQLQRQLGDAHALGHAAVLAVDADRKGVVVNHAEPYSVPPWRRYPKSMC